MNIRALKRRHYQRMWFTVGQDCAVGELMKMFDGYLEHVSTFTAQQVYNIIHHEATVDKAHNQG